MCRDLCFHSHEKCYSTIEIKEILEEVNLEFLGFILPINVKDKFTNQYKDDIYLKNLNYWNKFEENNKGCFREMYQFWTRKIN